MDLLADLEARGLLHDSTERPPLVERLTASGVVGYCGFDPTSDSLHVGSLLSILALRRLQDAGHRPVALVGGATGMIGDPSGRSEERNLLDVDELAANAAGIRAVLARFLDLDGAARCVDNADWTQPLGLIDFLRDVGKHFTVNQMVAKESVRSRMEGTEGISFTEFSYMLLQAHDYLWLYDHLGCELQVGGSDQWGNIVAGIDLVRRVRGPEARVHGWTWPLLTGPDGMKFGKTAAGTSVWLTAERTTPYRFHQFWIDQPDDAVGRLLNWMTMLPVVEIADVMARHDKEPHRRFAQRRLADEVTTFVHGASATRAATDAGELLFTGGVTGVAAESFELLESEIPSARVARRELEEGADVVELLSDRSGLLPSRSEARRALEAGSVYLNGSRLDPGAVVGSDSLQHGRWLLLRQGKKRHLLLVAEG